MKKRLIAVIISVMCSISIFAGCGKGEEAKNLSDKTIPTSVKSANENKEFKKPKYIFLFMGDGMSHVQVNAAQVYLGSKNNKNVDVTRLGFTQFPVSGMATTQDSTSFCPDSASTATAVSSGVKTQSGVIGLSEDKKTVPENISEKLKKDGYKVGVVSSVSLDHATPAAFYAHTESRGNMYDISLQLGGSGFDYFGGGSLAQPKGKEGDKEDAFKVIKDKGYKIANSKEEILSLDNKSGKVYAVSPNLQDSSAIEYDIDSSNDDLKLKDFVKKGIDVLDNDKGFFLMAESGKIDWACHANDAKTAIQDVIAFDEAIKEAVEFSKKHPDDTLILVTGDHETGGMTIGNATTGYNTAFKIMDNQKMSYVEFDKLVQKYKEDNKGKGSLKDLLPVIKENFGLIKGDQKSENSNEKNILELSNYEYEKLEKAFIETMKDEKDRSKDEASSLLYGTYEPLTVTLTHILNNKAGIGWTSYAHTGTPVPVFATGTSAEIFNGSYDNTDIFNKLVEICKLK